uniref:Uncharacterized protein n=1 Tax=Arundo donax TaxID=35708 RepID=A0A0A9BNZ7_ARUDO
MYALPQFCTITKAEGTLKN